MKDVLGTKYITQSHEGVYRIQKKINGKQYCFGYYDHLEDAIYYRDYFQRKGWHKCLNERNNYTSTNKTRNYDTNKRYIRKSGKHYRIDKDIDGKKYNFGTYDTLEEAICIRDYFEENNWPLDERLKYTNAPLYISGNPERGWEVRKIIGGECLHMGTFKKYEEAEKEVEIYKQCGWDLDAICSGLDDTVDGETQFLKDKLAGSFYQKYPQGRNDIFLVMNSKKYDKIYDKTHKVSF